MVTRLLNTTIQFVDWVLSIRRFASEGMETLGSSVQWSKSVKKTDIKKYSIVSHFTANGTNTFNLKKITVRWLFIKIDMVFDRLNRILVLCIFILWWLIINLAVALIKLIFYVDQWINQLWMSFTLPTNIHPSGNTSHTIEEWGNIRWKDCPRFNSSYLWLINTKMSVKYKISH